MGEVLVSLQSQRRTIGMLPELLIKGESGRDGKPVAGDMEERRFGQREGGRGG
jgi:hypothetical protein